MSNEILTKLLLDYDKKKQKAELDLEQRKQELFEKIPRLQEIENDLNMFAINTAKNILNGNSSSLDSLNSKVNILKSEKEKILKENNIPSNYLKPHYECNICNDTGYIQTENSASVLPPVAAPSAPTGSPWCADWAGGRPGACSRSGIRSPRSSLSPARPVPSGPAAPQPPPPSAAAPFRQLLSIKKDLIPRHAVVLAKGFDLS